jgi:hypothetical protein
MNESGGSKMSIQPYFAEKISNSHHEEIRRIAKESRTQNQTARAHQRASSLLSQARMFDRQRLPHSIRQLTILFEGRGSTR